MNNQNVLLEVKGLKKYFPITKGILFQREVGAVKAVDHVSFKIYEGETLGLVGESGCGKTTTGRTILQLYKPTDGQVVFAGENLTEKNPKEMRKLRYRMQMIFQDPMASLNPRWTISTSISEPLQVHQNLKNKEKLERVEQLLELVQLNSYYVNRYPHEFSGGQLQRIGIARALATSPEFIICDEPISALDVSIQAQIINLLKDLQQELGLTILFIAHDLSVIKHISDRVAVMCRGRLSEAWPVEDLSEHEIYIEIYKFLDTIK